MTVPWPVTTVGAVSLLVTKGTTPTTPYQLEGIPFVKVESLTASGRIDPARVAFIDSHTHETPLRRSMLRHRDLLFSIAGTIGRVARVTPADLPANTNQAVAIIRPDPDVVDSDYLFYCLRDKDRIRRARSRVVQSVQQNLSLAELSSVEIPQPPIDEQRRIAATLAVLDDKIDSNRRIIDLIPKVIAAEVQAALATESLHVPVASLARFVNGGAYTKGATGFGRMVIRIGELASGPGASTVYNELDVPEDRTAYAGDLLMSWSGSLDIYRWAGDEAIINQHIFKVIPAHLPAWLVYDRVKTVMPIFQSIARDKATTMGHIQRGHLESTSVTLPGPHAIVELDRANGPLWERLLLAEQEARALAALRDALLPELLSGRIRVPGARALT